MEVTERLACGRELDDIFADLTEGDDESTDPCPYCQQARDDIREVAALTRLWRDSADIDPDQQPSPSIRNSIMNVVRDEFRGGRRVQLRHTEFGPIRVREAAVGQLVRDATAGLPGIRTRGFRVVEPINDSVLRVVVGLSVHIAQLDPGLIRRARAVIVQRLSRELGVPVAADLSVEDVHEN